MKHKCFILSVISCMVILLACMSCVSARADEAMIKYSHTPNISDSGEQLSNYVTNLELNDVVTIEGATKLSVIIVYGGESSSWDWVCMWAGNYPSYTAYNNYSSSVTNKLGGGNHTDPANTQSYMVDGDTVTFGYHSDSSGCGDGYGYYAIIWGVMP